MVARRPGTPRMCPRPLGCALVAGGRWQLGILHPAQRGSMGQSTEIVQIERPVLKC